MRRPTGTRERGFTTIELIMTLGLVAAAIAGIGGAVGTTVRLTRLHEGRLDAQQGARRALERIIEELRWAEGIVPDPLCSPGGLCPQRIRVRIPGGNAYRQSASYEVTFQHNPRQQEVERRVGSGTTNLASLIQRVEFTYLDRHGAHAADPSTVARIRVGLMAMPRDSLPVVIEADVAPRNLRSTAAAIPSPSPTVARTPAWRPAPRRPFGSGSPSFRGAHPPAEAPALR